MSGTYSMNYGIAGDTIQQLVALDGRVNDALTDLENFSESTLSEWTAEARNAYDYHKAMWRSHAAAMANALSTAGNSLQQIMDSIQSGDRSATSLWS